MSKADAVKLRAARALITDRRHWTSGALARTDRRGRCRPEHPRAVRWCAQGALERVGAIEAWERNRPGDYLTVIHVNDLIGHEAVLALLDRAAALAEAEEATP